LERKIVYNKERLKELSKPIALRKKDCMNELGEKNYKEIYAMIKVKLNVKLLLIYF